MNQIVSRFDVYLASFAPAANPNPTFHTCVIISPNEMNRYISTVIVAPMFPKGQDYPTRIRCRFQGKDGHIVLDQLQTIDQTLLVKRLGRISTTAQRGILQTLAELFAE